jgi:hypothetical protein
MNSCFSHKLKLFLRHVPVMSLDHPGLHAIKDLELALLNK